MLRTVAARVEDDAKSLERLVADPSVYEFLQVKPDNGYHDQLITSEDGSDGSIDAAEIERTARTRILLED